MIDKLSLRLGEGGSCINNDVKRDTNLFVTPPCQIEVSAIRSIQLSCTNLCIYMYKAHVFQLHVHHSLSCVALRQYRACVVDFLGLGIMCLIGERSELT